MGYRRKLNAIKPLTYSEVTDFNNNKYFEYNIVYSLFIKLISVIFLFIIDNLNTFLANKQ